MVPLIMLDSLVPLDKLTTARSRRKATGAFNHNAVFKKTGMNISLPSSFHFIELSISSVKILFVTSWHRILSCLINYCYYLSISTHPLFARERKRDWWYYYYYHYITIVSIYSSQSCNALTIVNIPQSHYLVFRSCCKQSSIIGKWTFIDQSAMIFHLRHTIESHTVTGCCDDRSCRLWWWSCIRRSCYCCETL